VTLVEFAIVLPLFVTTLFSMVEFGFVFNAVLAINRASQYGALVAGQAGNDSTADCQILRTIEENLTTPLNKRGVTEVRIMRTNTSGSTALASNVYSRTGTKDCDTYSVPYSATSTGYPEDQRCNVLDGCPAMTPARTTVDKVAVQITYRYTAITPMGELLKFLDGGTARSATWTFSKRNLSRMEPVL
jgi:Flp pilus assembly protein TadG